jgi:hypothetical protein
MIRKLLIAIAVLTASLTVTAIGLGAGSATTKLAAKLNTAQEVPKPDADKGTGRFTATLTGRSLRWKLTFKNLTGPASAAHIHLGKRGVAGAVAVPLCGPCTSGAHGKTRVTASLARTLKRGKAYVNVHTTKNAEGEIRGQIHIAS